MHLTRVESNQHSMWCVSKGSKASAESVFKRIFGIGCERLHSKGRKKVKGSFRAWQNSNHVRSNEKDLTNVMCLQILHEHNWVKYFLNR